MLAGALLLVAGAELLVRFEPVQAPRPAAAEEYVQLQADERLFTLFAALNAAGYDEENNEQGMSDVRRQVRAALTQPGGATSPLPPTLRPYLALCRFIHDSTEKR